MSEPASGAPSRPARRDALRDEEPIQLEGAAQAAPDARREGQPAGQPEGRPEGRARLALNGAGVSFPAYWQGVLGAGETVLWAGAPDPALAPAAAPPGPGRKLAALWLAAAVPGVALVATGVAGTPGRIAGGVFAVASLSMAARGLFPGRAGPKQRTSYLLTDKALYLAALHSGETPASQRFAIDARTAVSAGEASVTFDFGLSRPDAASRQRATRVELTGLADAAALFDRVRTLQKRMK